MSDPGHTKPSLMRSEAELRSLARDHHQEHLFHFWKDLENERRAALLSQIDTIDFELMDSLFQSLVLDTAAGSENAKDLSTSTSLSKEDLAPAPVVQLPRNARERTRESHARQRGEELLGEGKVAAFVVAGGQGSRLGFAGPKGTYPIGPVTERTLFELFASKLLASSRRYGHAIPWLLMVSDTTEQPTIEYFHDHDFLGLKEDEVKFFKQDMIPAIDKAGKFLLARQDHVFTSPDGHGGSLKALFDSGSLHEMRQRGIEYIFYFQVDNPLINVCDPVFLGYHALDGADMSSKVLHKQKWSERVGLLCLKEGKPQVIEYSDLPEDIAKSTLEHGGLEYWAGSIGIHIFSVDFIEALNSDGFQLPYHLAAKTVPFLETRGANAGSRVEPAENNAYKFETFVFDALGHASRTISMEVRREQEFSPVKNPTGEESPATSRRDLTALYVSWLEEHEARIERQPDDEFRGHVEISPLTALEASDLEGKVTSDTVVRDGFVM